MSERKQIKISASAELHAKLSELADAAGEKLATFCLKSLHEIAGVKYKPHEPYFGTISKKKARKLGAEGGHAAAVESNQAKKSNSRRKAGKTNGS